MENCFVFADRLGPTKIVHVYEPSIQLRALLVDVADSHGATETATLEAIAEWVRRNTRQVLEDAKARRILSR